MHGQCMVRNYSLVFKVVHMGLRCCNPLHIPACSVGASVETPEAASELTSVSTSWRVLLTWCPETIMSEGLTMFRAPLGNCIHRSSTHFRFWDQSWQKKIPAVPRKAVAEVSQYEAYKRGSLLWIMDGRAKQLMDQKVVGSSHYLSVYQSLYQLSWLSKFS